MDWDEPRWVYSQIFVPLVDIEKDASDLGGSSPSSGFGAVDPGVNQVVGVVPRKQKALGWSS